MYRTRGGEQGIIAHVTAMFLLILPRGWVQFVIKVLLTMANENPCNHQR